MRIKSYCGGKLLGTTFRSTALLLCLSLGLGCDPNGANNGDNNDDEEGCVEDLSVSPQSAIDTTSETEMKGNFCPRRDVDFYRVRTTGGQKLIRATVSYSKFSNIRLSLNAFGPRSICVAEPALSCPEPSCPMGMVCDARRALCRANPAEHCLVDEDCPAGRCLSMEEGLLDAPVSDSSNNPALHFAALSIPAPVAGDYIFSVFDANEQESESEILYTFKATVVDDPDTNEANDTPNIATPLALSLGPTPSDVLETTGFLSHDEDVDWYRLDFSPSGQSAIVEIEVSWPKVPGAESLEPTWLLKSDGLEFGAPFAQERGIGSETEGFRRSTLALGANSSPFIAVQKTTGTSDTEFGYTLSLRYWLDTDEPTSRNDTPDTATIVDATAFGNVLSESALLSAENDVDWFRLDQGAQNEQSILEVLAEAPASAPYLLRWQTFSQSGVSCSDDFDCVDGPCWVGAGQCLAWTGFQRPSQDGPGDPQLGGDSPNYLHAKVPFFDNGGVSTTGSVFVRVAHIDETFLDLAGFGEEPYQLSVDHVAEPEVFERASLRSEYLARPFDVSGAEFASIRRAQSVSVSESGGGGGLSFAQIISYQVLPAGSCTQVNVEGVDAEGVMLPGLTNVSVTATLGAVVASCADPEPRTPISAFDLNDGVAAVGIEIPAATPDQDLSITLFGAGLASTDSLFSVASAGTPVFSFAPGNTRASLVDGVAALTLSNPVPGSTDEPLVGLFPASVSQMGLEAGNFYCECGVDCSDACTVSFDGVEPSSVLRVMPTATGILRVVLSAPGYGRSSFNLSAHLARRLETAASGVFSVSGYLSYDGDQDWYSIDTAGFPAASVVFEVDYAATDVDGRFQVQRGSAATGFGRSNDQCPCSSGGSCDTQRQTCSQGDFATTNAPPSLDPSVNCTFLPSSDDTTYLWVNDVNFNDGDVGTAYGMRVALVEGCGTGCPATFCE